MTDPRLTPLAAALPATVPFTGPEALERRRGVAFRARLGANESGFGPSPHAVEAMKRAARDAWMYGDPEVQELRDAIAERHGCDPAHIVVGEGIDGLLGLLVRLTVGAGTPVVSSMGGYPTFAFHVAGFGGRLLTVPYLGDSPDPEGLMGLAREAGARLVYIANPDNPMGGMHGADVIRRMVEGVPEGGLLVLDEAYAELAPEGSLPVIDPADPRVIRLRTFSKAQGLAGLRVGYAVGPRGLVAAFDRVRNHFGLGRVAQAGALAAIHDEGWAREVARRVAEGRAALGRIAAANGLAALPSCANFVAIDCGRDGVFARAVLDGLLSRGVFVRMPGVAPLDRCIRVTVGPEDSLAVFAEALPGALEEAGAAG
ncbi:pyridoxal phosphate-dependent aminotransferase [Rubellimicrobium aerolatum]|uniref:histidinol-phosphate transaminase n=1 Tax=Rubellimicrobium aerolatum TaxID=490979 RepID=A0ABW0SC29_9RHOB|nr:pyridoxal phosphate-dependent aminotransferase [Rubellimicrobium aerolatum]MBP1806223.1 histidinol-phosphate aminotransferase [Rubellimicrobium aerolatum]